MDSKHLDLLRVLIDKYPECVTAQVLAAHLSITSRSVKNYIKELNTLHPGVAIPTRSGYRVDMEIAKALLNSGRELLPQTSRQRASYILEALLKRQMLNKYDICEELFISISTLQGVLPKVKRQLAEVDLRLNTEKDFLSIHGTEQNKRKLYSNVLYEECNTNFMDLNAVQRAFPEIDISRVKETVDEVLSGYQFFVNDYVLTNLVLHIAIAVNRMRNGNVNAAQSEAVHDIHPLKREAAEKIAAALETMMDIHYTEAETTELTLLLTYRVNFVSETELDSKGIQTFVEPETLDLVKKISDSVCSIYGISLDDEYFFIRFALHIHNLLLRSQKYHYTKNPLTEGIRASSPMIYEISVYVSSLIKERINVTINDDEIAYIAMHLGSAICIQKAFDTKIKAVLYCPNYYNMNNRLAKMIEDRFAADLVLTAIYTDEAQIDEVGTYDLVIATVPLNHQVSACVQVNVFFQGRSEADLKQHIEMLKQKKRREQFERYLRHIITPNLFEVNSTLKNEKEVIRHMVNKMVSLGYVDASFEDQVYARERISSTAFNGFAIPHSLTMEAHKTGMYILISPNPVVWGEKNVHLMLMLCFKADERHIFHEIFDSLTTILNDHSAYSRIIQCTDYEGFIHLVSSLAE